MKHPSLAVFTVMLAALLGSCVSTSPKDGLGAPKFKITTKSREAQRAFDRGMTHAYGFAYQAAEEEFRAAAAADPQCAMAWWGVALVNGPHINLPTVAPENAKEAWEALGKAQERAAKTTAKEQALISALGKRYAWPQPANRRPLDEAYANAMRKVWQDHPADADVATLFAESLMDLRPWDLWTLEGKPKAGTSEIVTTLERALVLNPKHPGANHLYIHAVEASSNPGRALAAANRLRDLVPSSGHLLHMPSHIYARVGRWSDASAANVRAIRADAAYRAKHPKPGFYALYMMHNMHFLGYTSMMEGQSAESIRCARQMVNDVPADFLQSYAPAADGYMVFPSKVLMRFGKWEEVLAEPEPAANLPLARSFRHYCRTIALIALDRRAEAETEKAAFHASSAQVPKNAVFGNNSAHDLLAIATHVINGELAAKDGLFDKSIVSLRRAVALEDLLRYDEPPDWIQPARHTMGAVMLRAGRYEEAENVYRTDLGRYPNNGWSLFGLSRALKLQGKEAEAAQVEAQFQRAWAKADTKIESTCFCQPGV